MHVDRARLVEATQLCFHVLDDAPPIFVPVRADGVRGRLGPTPYPPLWNEIGMATLEPHNAAAAIERVVAPFRRAGEPFGWLVGPASTPRHLGGYLEAAGLRRIPSEAGVGMAFADAGGGAGSVPGVRVEEVGFDEVRRSAAMIAAAFGSGMDRAEFGAGMTIDDAGAFIDALASIRDSWRSRGYLAFVRGCREPVGFGLMVDSGQEGVVWMIAAGTREGYRGRGVYRSLVDRRARDAHAAGARGVVTVVNRATTAAIVRRVGFKELCELELYGWSPRAAASALCSER